MIMWTGWVDHSFPVRYGLCELDQFEGSPVRLLPPGVDLILGYRLEN